MTVSIATLWVANYNETSNPKQLNTPTCNSLEKSKGVWRLNAEKSIADSLYKQKAQIVSSHRIFLVAQEQESWSK